MFFLLLLIIVYFLFQSQSEQQTEHEDEEEEEVEPLLKYNRLGNDLKKVLSADPASCLAVHSKVSPLK